MKKIMAGMVALMFAFSMAFTGLVLADSAAEKGKAPMSEKAKDGAEVSKDAKDKGKSQHEAKMGKKDKKEKKSKKGKKSKKSKKNKKKS